MATLRVTHKEQNVWCLTFTLLCSLIFQSSIRPSLSANLLWLRTSIPISMGTTRPWVFPICLWVRSLWGGSEWQWSARIPCSQVASYWHTQLFLVFLQPVQPRTLWTTGSLPEGSFTGSDTQVNQSSTHSFVSFIGSHISMEFPKGNREGGVRVGTVCKLSIWFAMANYNQ